MYSQNETRSFESGRAVVRLGRDFCEETSVHGFKHIAEPRRHWIERVLWAVATCLAFYGAIDVSMGQLQRYQDSPTVVTLEKDFRSWRYSLPAITICMKNRVDPTKLPEVINNYWDTEPSDERYEYYSKFVNLVANSDLLTLDGYSNYTDDDLDVDLFQLVYDVMPKNDEAKVLSSESVRLFKWTPVMTESGVCYSTNSLTVDDVAIVKAGLNETKDYPVTCKHAALTCYMMVEVYKDAYFILHSPYDVSDILTPSTMVALGYNYPKVELSVTETGCGKGVRTLQARRRGCRYTEEPESTTRHIYSTNSCRQSCRSRLAVNECGCRPFYYFYEEGRQCTASGMACLAKLKQKLANIACTCSPQCEYSVFQEIAKEDPVIWGSGGVFGSKGSVKYSIKAPRTRYTREIVFHFQDLVVSFGGAAGLFLGASFISLVEMLYFLIVRLFRTVANVRQSHVKEKSIPFEMKQILDLTALLEKNRP